MVKKSHWHSTKVSLYGWFIRRKVFSFLYFCLPINCLYFILHLKILFGCLEGIRLLLQRIIISGWKFYVQFLLLLNKQWYDLLIVRSMASLLLCDIISIRMHQLVFRERWFFYFFILPLLYKIDLYLIQPVHVLDDLMKVCERAPGESDR